MDMTAFALEAKSIATKRSHVKQAFDKLIEKMSEFVKDVQDTLPPISSSPLSTQIDDEGYRKWDVVLTYVSVSDGYFRIDEVLSLCERGEWLEATVHTDYRPSVREIREIAPKIPDAVAEILQKLRERGREAEEGIKTIEELLAKLQ